MAGEFAALLTFCWRSKHYPLTRLSLSLAHDLVEHKYWGVDGGRIEDTGVAPMRIAATIPIGHHIYPGTKEKWQAGALYPAALRPFILDFAKRTTGLVQHPEFGEIKCKADRLEFALTGERQGATEIQATWIETLDEDVVATIRLAPVADLQGAADDLEASGADLRKLAPELPEFKEDIASLGRKLSSIADAVTVMSYRQMGVVNQIIYQAHRMQVAIDRAKSALTWPATQNLHRVKSAAFSLRQAFLTPGGIGLYTVMGDTPLEIAERDRRNVCHVLDDIRVARQWLNDASDSPLLARKKPRGLAYAFRGNSDGSDS